MHVVCQLFTLWWLNVNWRWELPGQVCPLLYWHFLFNPSVTLCSVSLTGSRCPFTCIHLDKERHCGAKLSFLARQDNGIDSTFTSKVQWTNNWTCTPHCDDDDDDDDDDDNDNDDYYYYYHYYYLLICLGRKIIIIIIIIIITIVVVAVLWILTHKLSFR